MESKVLELTGFQQQTKWAVLPEGLDREGKVTRD